MSHDKPLRRQFKSQEIPFSGTLAWQGKSRVVVIITDKDPTYDNYLFKEDNLIDLLHRLDKRLAAAFPCWYCKTYCTCGRKANL